MDSDNKTLGQFDAQKLVNLPQWVVTLLLLLLAALGIGSALAAWRFFWSAETSDRVIPLIEVVQTTISAIAIVLFVRYAERQLNTPRLYQKTDQFLEQHLLESLRRIEIPQLVADQTVDVRTVARPPHVHGRRKDIFGCNYHLGLAGFHMKMWVGINVKRLAVIYFAKVDGEADAHRLKEAFHYTFSGAEKVGYHTHFEYALVGDEHIVSMWSTALAENAILGNPAEQLFWTQDVAMMTQSLARTAVRRNICLSTVAEPGPL